VADPNLVAADANSVTAESTAASLADTNYLTIAMKDVFNKFQPIQGPGYTLLNPDRTAIRDSLLPVVVIKETRDGVIKETPGIDVPGWHVLDPSKPNGLNVRQIDYPNVAGGLKNELGTVLVGEREKGATRLFLLWVSRTAERNLKARAFDKVNLHLIFHTPPFDCYTSTDYWTGTCTIDGLNNACLHFGLKGQQPYVSLGIRYLCSDFRAVAQHLLAVSGRQPNVIYVVPVADERNFSDLVSGDALTRLAQEVVIFAAQQVANSTIVDGFVDFGKVMVSGYSRSADRIEELMKGMSAAPSAVKSAFFRRHLSQINLFDPNVHSDAKIRLDRFKKLIENVSIWKSDFNRTARIFVYTAYSDHMQVALGSRLRLGSPINVDLDAAAWSEHPGIGSKADRRRLPGAQPRGHGIEAYNDDGSVGLVHVPINFFELWLQEESIPPNPAGFNHKIRGNGHGHGWFHRTLMAHALAHAEPSWYGDPRV
jgi:hypothetical protein